MRSSPRVLVALALLSSPMACVSGGEATGETDEAATTGGEASGRTSDSDATGGAGTTSEGGVESNSSDPGDSGPLPEGDACCEAHRGPGCNEPDVVECVCARDVACCGFDWDDACATAATELCAATCQAGVTAGPGSETDGSTGDATTGSETGGVEGSTGATADSDCCFEQQGAGCDDTPIQDCVCAFDPYCCNTLWDDQCVTEAQSDCALVCG